MRLNRRYLIIILSFLAGAALYIFAVISIFSQGNYAESLSPFILVSITFFGGLGALIVGYVSEILFGGILSLRLAELVARVNRSRHIIEVTEEDPKTTRPAFRDKLFPFLVVALIFVTSIILVWDMNSLHPANESILHSIIHELDFLQDPFASNPLAYIGDIVPEMIVLIFLAGAAPSMALPYFRKFKITGVNTSPFHTFFIYAMIGIVGGVGIILTLARLVLNVIAGAETIFYFDYVFPMMWGLYALRYRSFSGA